MKQLFLLFAGFVVLLIGSALLLGEYHSAVSLALGYVGALGTSTAIVHFTE